MFRAICSIKPADISPVLVEREAMWINFKSRAPFAIRVYVGGVNGLTGKPTALDNLPGSPGVSGTPPISENKEQDYFVTPAQPWLDGVALSPGVVRQFVAMPKSSGYSIE